MRIPSQLALAFLVSCLPLFTAGQTAGTLPPGTCCADDNVQIIPAYEGISQALSADDLEAAIDASEDLGLWAECSEEVTLDRAIADLERSRTLDEARIAFREISREVIRLTKWIPGHYVMTCPMARADWIQTEPEVANPYYGTAMLRCGSIKETVEE